MLTPFTASANTDPVDTAETSETAEETAQTVKPFKEKLTDESTMQQKAAIAEQLNLLGGEAKLHDELQNVTGNQQVPVIIHLSEKSVGLEKGIQKLAGKSFTAAQAQQTKQKVRSQQIAVKKEMVIKGIQFNEGFTYDTVLNGMSGTVKADDLPKLLEVNGVTLVEPDTIVYASELDKFNSPSKLNGLKKPAPSESKLEEKSKNGQVGSTWTQASASLESNRSGWKAMKDKASKSRSSTQESTPITLTSKASTKAVKTSSRTPATTTHAHVPMTTHPKHHQ